MKNDIKDVYKEYFDIVEDARLTGRTYNIPLTQLSDKRSLSIYANKLYKEIKRLSRETGDRRLNRATIRVNIPEKDIATYDLDRALKELVNAGYLLTYKNYTEF